MNAVTFQEAESVTRSIARWASAAAALIFGIAFVTDRALSWNAVAPQVVQVGLIVTMFVGYALAWTKRFEVLGSVIALISMVSAYVIYMVAFRYPPPPGLFFLAVGLPAVVHLLTVLLHRYVMPRVKA